MFCFRESVVLFVKVFFISQNFDKNVFYIFWLSLGTSMRT